MAKCLYNEGYTVEGVRFMLKVKTFLFVILLGLFFAGTGNAFHGTSLICNKCHTMHASENGVLPTMPGDTAPMTQSNPYLLYKSDVTSLCLVCHDQQSGTPDVVDIDINSSTERAAGQFATVDTVNPNGHNLGLNKIGSSNLCLSCHFGGDFNTAKIGCTDCHDPHGRDPGSSEYRYRNLQWASSPGSEPIITAIVNPAATGIAVYERANIGYVAPTGPETWREVSNICIDCHHNLSGDYYTRSSGHPIKHPVTDSERGASEPINQLNASTDPVHWENGVGAGFSMDRLPFIVSGAANFAEATTVAQNNEVFCLTCHKAHGNINESSLRWDYRASDPNLGCQQCHDKGE